eukprot:Skav234634  [mRNA]  locus=scaffold1609:57263:61717:- [translate_table: standard]
MVSSFHAGMHCIVGAAVYAPPSGPTYPNSRQLTSELLGTLTEEIVYGRQGPRFIAGDMNCDIGDLATFKLREAAGWRECQAWALDFKQRPRVPTCKGSTIRDHVWLSPALQQWAVDVQVLDRFADHSVVATRLSVPLLRFWQHVWPQPSVFPWSQIDTSQMDFSSQTPYRWQTLSVNEDFASWSRVAEGELCAQASHQVSLPSSVHGRGQTTKVEKRQVQLVPIRASRHGDVCPRSHLLGRRVHHWFRQVRRLQAFVQRAGSQANHAAKQHDQCATWSAIKRAPGFGSSFLAWWPTRRIKLHGSPMAFPHFPPSLELARRLFSDMEANYRALERWHLRRRTEIIQAKHQDHNKLLFKQLRGDSFGTLTHLRSTLSFTVAVIHSTVLVELDSPVPPLAGSVSWSLEGCAASVEVQPDRAFVTVDSDLLLAIGQNLALSMIVTDFQDVDKELRALWDPIWNRHAGLSEAHWERVIAFGVHAIPQRTLAPLDWTSLHLRNVVEGYKKKATRGPDSWGRADLCALSDLRLQDLVSLFQLIEDGSCSWPRQLVTGLVNPLPKIAGAESAVQFRPIVLISLLYRLWASASSKHVLPSFTQNISSHIFGYVPGRRATEVWSLLQMSLELALGSGQVMTGYCADLVRCFNRIPRRPLLVLLEHMGVPTRTLTAWTTALASLERRFRVVSNVGEAQDSCTGFPEGDPLSCLAMLAFNIVFDRYVQVYSPSSVPLAFVDNLQLVSHCASSLQHGVLVVAEFMAAWDLDLDPHKSYVWASCSRQRALLRSFGHAVRLHAKDLGAQLSYCAKVSKSVFHQRVDSVKHVWNLLRHSSAAPWFRKQAILVAIWPKVLHACEASWISEADCSKLRSRCMYALGWNRAGASPIVRWSFMQNPMLDPFFFQLWSVLSNFWRLSALYPYVREAWVAFRSLSHLSNQGIFHAMELALEALDWFLDDSSLAVHCWRQTLCKDLGQRKDFAGLNSIDCKISFGSLRLDTLAENELLATIQDGTFFLNRYLAKFDALKSATCEACGEHDTLEHRCLRCPKYATIRAQHTDAIESWDFGNPSFTHHGIVEMNPFLWDHWRFLLALPDTRQTYHAEPVGSAIHHVFTDGSCQHPSTSGSLAAWGVVLMDNNQVISDGVVPGLAQTSDLAELFAVHSALCWAAHFAVKVCIHSDSQYVLSGLDHLRRVGHVPGSWKYVHVWLQVLEVLRLLGNDSWDCHQVFSHQDYCSAADALQEWYIRGNQKADCVAARAQMQRPAAFMNNHRRLLEHDRSSRTRVIQQLKLLLALAQSDLQVSSVQPEWDPEDLLLSDLGTSISVNHHFLAQQVEGDFVQLLPRHLSGGFSFDFRRKLLTFIIDLDMQAATSRFVTGLELLAAFLNFGHGSIPIPRKVGDSIHYEDVGSVVGGGLIRVTFASALCTLRKALQVIFANLCLESQWGRDSRVEAGLHTTMWSIHVGWRSDFDGAVVSQLHTWAGGRPWRRACDFARPV